MRIISNPRNFHAERMAALRKANACLSEIVRAARDAARSGEAEKTSTMPDQPRTQMPGEEPT